VGSALIALGLTLGTALPSLADDPFRTSSPHAIGDLTESAFEAIFKGGDYVSAKQYLAQAETAEADEPLVHAMLASMAYLEGDSGLPEVARRAALTKEKAQALMANDPLRGHLYTAVGIFLEGAHMLKTQGVARGTPQALAMLQQVFGELDAAEEINANDPELNLLKGYMDLMLAVNLPFSNPEEAIARMEQYGSPVYLAQRGIAIGYRDLEKYDEAVAAVDQAIAAAPENPELFYLKAQLLARQGAQADSVLLFNKALEYQDQLPAALVKRIKWEGCVAEGESDVTCQDRAGY
jgi:tetratricopeptide (TPR) repeat protein